MSKSEVRTKLLKYGDECLQEVLKNLIVKATILPCHILAIISFVCEDMHSLNFTRIAQSLSEFHFTMRTSTLLPRQ